MSSRSYQKFVCHGVLVHKTKRSNLLKRFAWSIYCFIFHLMKQQTAASFDSLFQNFSVRGVGSQKVAQSLNRGVHAFSWRPEVCLFNCFRIVLDRKRRIWCRFWVVGLSWVVKQELQQSFALFVCAGNIVHWFYPMSKLSGRVVPETEWNYQNLSNLYGVIHCRVILSVSSLTEYLEFLLNMAGSVVEPRFNP